MALPNTANSGLANTTTLTTNFNVDPYYDDFDKFSNYNRILFRPGFALQARELTQIQSILQNQISSFGKHVFKEGSIVLPGYFNIDKDISYVKVNDIDNSGNTVTIANYDGLTVKGTDSGVVAIIFMTAEPDDATESKTIFVSYQNSGDNNTSKTFLDNEVLTAQDGSGKTLKTKPSAATGFGSMFTISDGVFYAKEHFIYFSKQSIILSKYSTNPSCKVGFYISEDIIRYTQDQSLLDPAQGSSNYSAPGADRFKLSPILYKINYTEVVGPPDYVALFSINEGIVETLYEKSQYAIINEYFAKRTFDESGDYYVNGLTTSIREDLDDGTNLGYSSTGSSSNLSVIIDPGEAYVKGYPVGSLKATRISISKATTFANVNNQVGATSEGNYFLVKEVVGRLEHDVGTSIDLYNTAQLRLTTSTGSPTGSGYLMAGGNKIGTAKLKSLDYDGGYTSSPSATFRLYLTDIQMLGSNSVTSIRSVYQDNADADFVADIVTSSNNALLYDSTQSLIYDIGAIGIKTVRATDGTSVDTSYSYKKSEAVTIAAGGTGSITITGDFFPYGNSATLTSTQKHDITLTSKDSFNVKQSGTITSGSGTTLNGLSTFFRDRLNVGDRLTLSTNTSYFIITGIANNTTLTLDKTVPYIDSNTFFKAYLAGDIIDLAGVGSDAGTTRSVVTGSGGQTITFDLKEGLTSSRSAYISYRVIKNTAREMAKTLRPARYMSINCASVGTSGPFCLGFSDIYKVNYIIKKTGSLPSSITDGTDVTSYFTVDNGQRDELYELGYITPNGVALGPTDFLLVQLDYFYPDTTQGQGYFSVDSYTPIINDTNPTSSQIKTSQIPVYTSPVTGIRYDLRNCLDFRPVKDITATDATTAGTASAATASTTFVKKAGLMYLAAPNQQLQYDYSYYVPRRDVVTVDKDGNFVVTSGVPSVAPVTPVSPENTMVLSSLYISPYPSLSPTYSQIVNRKDLACTVRTLATQRLTMRDLQTMKQRIENLEYYVALNLLEKSAVNLKIPDSAGNDRFKNGIFTDTFADHSLGASTSTEYRITVDSEEKSIRPIYDMFSIPYRTTTGGNTDCVIVGDYVMLPYTEQSCFTQNVATGYRNMETNVYRYYGTMNVRSSTSGTDNDFWVDLDQLDKNNLEITSNNYDGGPLTTDWNAWQTTITGYNIYDSSGRVLTTISADQDRWTVNSQAQALAQAYGSVQLETVTKYDRTGTEHYLKTISASVDFGNQVVNVDQITYIRPQTLTLTINGVKANTKFYTFFDGRNMTSYTRPLTSNGAYVGVNTAINVSSANGQLFAEMQIPTTGIRFTTGTKQIVVTDSPTNESDATSSATGYFSAQGLVQQKQQNILSTRTIIRAQREVPDSYTDRPITNFNRIVRSSSCMGYSFLVRAPEGEEGLFLSSVDLYIAGKSSTLGFWIEIREMDAGGGITRNAIPLSSVNISDPNSIIISDDASKAMNIKFQVPIFLYADRQYALLMHPYGSNPDMYFWVAKTGLPDVTSGTQFTSRSQTGTLYQTNNDLNWDIVPNTDLKVTFYRAVFDTTKTGTLTLGNNPFEFFRLSNVTSGFNYYGETIKSLDQFTLSTGTVANSDIILGRTSGANGAVLSNVGGKYVMANAGYILGETVNVYNSYTWSDTGLTATIATMVASASGTVLNYKVSGSNAALVVSGSNGNFTIGNNFIGMVSKKRAQLANVDNLAYSTVDFEPTFLAFNKSTYVFEMQAGSGSYFKINNNHNYTFGAEQTLYSASMVGGAPTNNVRITLKSASANGYTSPVIDLARIHSVYVRNIINANTYNENTVAGGALINKYVSKIVTLAEGQDAEDIRVIITGYRPPTSNIKIWVKIVNNEDIETIRQKPWVELGYVDQTRFSSIADPSDFIEYSFKFPSAPNDRLIVKDLSSGATINVGDVIVSNTINNVIINYTVLAVEGNIATVSGTGFIANSKSGGWANVRTSDGVTIKGNANISIVGSTSATIATINAASNVVQYKTDTGITYNGYKQFAVKIGLLANNSAVVPKVADLRVIALQV
jgi:hypothetical protein